MSIISTGGIEMKKTITFLIISCMILLCSCSSILPNSSNQTGANQNNTTSDNKSGGQNGQGQTNTQGTQNNTQGNTAGSENNVQTEATVNGLINTGKDFFDALYEGDAEGLSDICADTLKTKIDNDSKSIINTQPKYTISKIDTTIKPGEDDTYLLTSSISVVSKTDKSKKYTHKYSITIEKVKNDYFVIGYKKEA